MAKWLSRIAVVLVFALATPVLFASEPVVIKMASMGIPGDSLTRFYEYFGDELDKRTNGAVKVELFHSGQLGAQRDYMDSMQIGSIQMADVASSVLATIDPAFAVFDMPYISPDEYAQWETIKGGAGELLRKTLLERANLYVVGWVVRTPRNVYSSKEPIHSAKDFNGLKIRTMESPPMLRAMELLGAKATPIPGTERYLALQTKVVDAAENNSGEIYYTKEYEVTKYISKTSHIIQPNVYCMDNNFLSSLPADLQKTILEVAAEASEIATMFDFASVEEIEKKLVSECGMLINDIPDKSDFIQALQPLYGEYESKIGQELMDAFLKK